MSGWADLEAVFDSCRASAPALPAVVFVAVVVVVVVVAVVVVVVVSVVVAEASVLFAPYRCSFCLQSFENV